MHPRAAVVVIFALVVACFTPTVLRGASITRNIRTSPAERIFPDDQYYPYIVIPGRSVPLRAWKEIWDDKGTPDPQDDTEQDIVYIPRDSASLQWESSDPGVCQVSGSGIMTTVAAGDCTVTCTYTGTPAEGILAHSLPVSVIPLGDATMDLDLLFIERLRKTGPGEGVKFERNTEHAVPHPGETVIYRAYIANMGQRASGSFNAHWKVNGTEVAAAYVADLDVAGEMVPSGRYLPDPEHWYYASDVELLHHRNEMSLDLERAWSDGREEIELVLEPLSAVTDTNPDNNHLLIHSDAICLAYFYHEDNYLGMTHVQQVNKPYTAYAMQVIRDQTSWGDAEIATRTSSGYDRQQRCARVFNAQFADSKSPLLPDGISERVRAETWIVARDVMPYAGGNCWKLGDLDKAADLIWGWINPRNFAYYRDASIDADWCTLGGGLWTDYPMIHEISHARYLVDDYICWLTNNEIELTDDQGQRVFPLDLQTAFDLEKRWNHWRDPQWLVKGLYRGNMMQGAYWNGWNQQNAVAWERIQGIRWPNRCANFYEPQFDAYGEYFEDGAEENWIRIVGPAGEPLEGAVVEVHKIHAYRGTVTDQVDIEASTDPDGLADLGGNQLSDPSEYYPLPHTQPDEYYLYHPRHWWGADHSVLRIRYAGKSFYKFVSNQDLNLAFWSRCGWETIRTLILDGFYPNSPDPGFYPENPRPNAGSSVVLSYTIDPSWNSTQEIAHRDEVPAFDTTGVYVTAPAHGDVLLGGSQTAITWDSVGETGSDVTIRCSLDAGITWSEIAPGTAKPNSGTYAWDVPDLNAALCKVQVVPSAHEAYGGSSGGFFAILSSYPTPTPTETPTITPTAAPTTSPTPFPYSVKVDDKDAAVVYGGDGWTNWNDAADYLGSETNSRYSNAFAELSFTGTGIRWITALSGNLGQADVYLDGVRDAAAVDCYKSAPRVCQRILYGKDGLSPESHTIRVVVKQVKNPRSSDYYVAMDAFEYNALPTPTGATPTPTQTITPTATPTMTPTPFPYSVMVDDKDAAVVYGVGGWGNWDQAEDYHGSETNSDVVNSYAELSFTGTGIRWITALNSNLGKADIYLDGELDAAGVDCYKPAPKAFQRILYGKGGLSPGSHTIRVVVTRTKNPHSVAYYATMDAFEYNALPTPTGATPTPTPTRTPTTPPTNTPTPFPYSVKVDDKDAAVVYGGGGWTNWDQAEDYHGSETNSKTRNSYAEISFTGTGIRWISSLNQNLGKADIYLDGALDAAGVDCYKPAPKVCQRILYGKEGISPGAHTIRVVVTQTKNPQSADYYVSMDAFEYNALPTPTPTTTPTITPTQTPCHEPLSLPHIDNLHLATPRSVPDGFAYFFGAAADPLGQALAYIYDSNNAYIESDSFPSQPIEVYIARDGATISVTAGDYITLTRDDATTLRVYFPALNTDEDVVLYIGADGSTYWDAGLCSIARPAVAPTPICVNFQPAAATTPPGFPNTDTGAAYGNHGWAFLGWR